MADSVHTLSHAAQAFAIHYISSYDQEDFGICLPSPTTAYFVTSVLGDSFSSMIRFRRCLLFGSEIEFNSPVASAKALRAYHAYLPLN